MLSSQEIADHVANITAAVTALARGYADLARCADIDACFEALRTQYKEQPETLADRVQELAGLRARFDAALSERLPQAVDRFHAVMEQIHRAEQERQFWRKFLARQAETSHCEQLRGSLAVVRVRSIRSRKLPPSRSSERAELEALIRDADQWEEVSQLSRPKLERCLDQERFAPPTAQAIHQLCPPTVTYQVSSRPVAQGTAEMRVDEARRERNPGRT